MIRKTLITAVLAVLSASAVAAVSEQEAAQLGKNLTPVGAEKAGNKDGTIPEWTGDALPDQALTDRLALQHALDRLPPGYRTVLVLRAEGFTWKEASAALGMPLKSAYDRARRLGRERLHDRLLLEEPEAARPVVGDRAGVVQRAGVEPDPRAADLAGPPRRRGQQPAPEPLPHELR